VSAIGVQSPIAASPDATTVLTDRAAEAIPTRSGFSFSVSLLGGFTLACGDLECQLPQGCERLVALLAIRTSRLRRAAIAGTLWPDSDDRRASASLRSALTRLRGVGCAIVESRSGVLRLGADVRIDVVEARELARRVIESNMRQEDVTRTSITVLSFDLLPGWYDDWVIVEAEDWHQLRLHALEALSATFTHIGLFAHAVSAAMAAIKGDPWRESARQALVKAHLAENNKSEAIREFERYRRLLHDEMGLTPSMDFATLIGPIVSSRT
jgi:SARP family transcriptional regulator, regulator of embCAB operon